MSFAGSSALALILALSQNPIDPALPVEIRRDIEGVAAAELDPKRGPDTALARLAELQHLHEGNERLYGALRLRGAGVFLRKRFMAATQFPVDVRHQQALSTFTGLDLTEPGLAAWVEKTLEAHAKTQKKKGVPAVSPPKRIKIALLIRGSVLKRRTAQAALREPFDAVGYPVDFVSTKKAQFILKIGIKDAPSDNPALRAVHVSLDIEAKGEDGSVTWERGFFRTESAGELEPAIEAALEWLARIGGRDLFFHWLSTTSLPFLGENPFVRGARPHRHELRLERRP